VLILCRSFSILDDRSHLPTRAGWGNATAVQNALSSLGTTTEEGCDACIGSRPSKQAEEVADVILAGWLRSPVLTAADHVALQAIAEVLGMHRGNKKDWSEAGLKVVTAYLDEQYAGHFC
jgi:hypothetical protein